jgi:hypothetical protein
VGRNRVRLDPAKLNAIRDCPEPKTAMTEGEKRTAVREFLGFYNLYKEYIYRYSDIARPLIILTGKTK